MFFQEFWIKTHSRLFLLRKTLKPKALRHFFSVESYKLLTDRDLRRAVAASLSAW
jgi:hypothetical protein